MRERQRARIADQVHTVNRQHIGGNETWAVFLEEPWAGAQFHNRPPIAGRAHYGSRLAWAKDGTLFVTTGERYTERDIDEIALGVGKVAHHFSHVHA